MTNFGPTNNINHKIVLTDSTSMLDNNILSGTNETYNSIKNTWGAASGNAAIAATESLYNSSGYY